MRNRMRLDKFVSEATGMTRKEARERIRTGCVSVNGRKTVQPDCRVNETSDRIESGGQVLHSRKYVYLMLNKPGGYLSAVRDPHDPVVTDLVPAEYRHFSLFPVGRLDKDAEGLLLLTNDGRFDHALMSPKRHVPKRYFAVLDRPAEASDAEAFRAGMTFPDFTARPAVLEISADDPKKVRIGITEGKFHQVKRMCERVGKHVEYLKRIAIGPLPLDETLKPGEIRELTDEELRMLFPEA